MVIWSEPFGGIRLRRHILVSLLVQVVSHMLVLFFNITKFAFPGNFLPFGDILFAYRLIFQLIVLLKISLEEVIQRIALSCHDFIVCYVLSFSLSIGRSLGLLHLGFALSCRWNAHGLLFNHLRHHLRLRFGCHRLHWRRLIIAFVLLVNAHHLLLLNVCCTVVKFLTNLLWLSFYYSFKVARCRLAGLGSLAATALLLFRWCLIDFVC